MPKYRRNEEGDVERLVSLQVEVWVGKDGTVETVNESAHLGTKVMEQGEYGIYKCIREYNNVPISFTLNALGKVAPKTIEVEGMHTHTTDVFFNALSWLDEPEKVANLSDAEKIELQNIGIIQLNNKLLAALKKVPRVWTPMADAAMAIMQHAAGTQEDFPKPVVVQHHNEEVVTGDHADGADATLMVGKNKFVVGDKYFRFVAYGLCGGKERYAFTWMDVPESLLNG